MPEGDYAPLINKTILFSVLIALFVFFVHLTKPTELINEDNPQTRTRVTIILKNLTILNDTHATNIIINKLHLPELGYL
jgi:hypothetical protein